MIWILIFVTGLHNGSVTEFSRKFFSKEECEAIGEQVVNAAVVKETVKFVCVTTH